MLISAVNNFNFDNYSKNTNQLSFQAGGKPITLKYVVEKRSSLVPERVLEEAKKILSQTPTSSESLLDIHRRLYFPLLQMRTLKEIKEMFPEFEGINLKLYLREIHVMQKNSKRKLVKIL